MVLEDKSGKLEVQVPFRGIKDKLKQKIKCLKDLLDPT